MTAKRQAEAIARRLRAAAVTPPPATVTGSSSPILERVRRGADHLDCWTDPVIASRLDHRLRLTLTGIRPLNPNGVLAATFDGPFVVLRPGEADRRRNICSIETRHRGGRVDHRLRLGHPLGATGARLMTTLLHELQRTGGRYGLQTMCERGGMANVTIVERV